MKKFLEKNKKILQIIFMIVIISMIEILIFFIVNDKEIRINEVNKEAYSMQYDETWSITKEDELEIELVHKKSSSNLKIKITELEDENEYKMLDELFDSLLYNIQKQNKNYKLLYKEKKQITKNSIEAYKILFETDNTEAIVYFYKQGSKLVTIIYEADYEYFDILLDSVNNIIYNFSVKEQIYDIDG